MAWTDIVERYTACLLTFDKDKPIAIGGVANVVAAEIGLSFLEGLWKEFLFLEMLWEVDGNQPSARVNLAFPTWSWISMKSKIHTVYLRLAGRDTRFENWVEEAGKRLSDSNPLWAAELLEVREGRPQDDLSSPPGLPTALQLRVDLKKVKITDSPFAFSAQKRTSYPKRLWSWRLQFEDDPEQRAYSWRPDEVYEAPVSSGTSFLNRVGSAWALPLVKWRVSPAGLRVAGIVVIPVEESKTNEWRRIGRYDFRLGSVPNADFYTSDAPYEHFHPWDVGERHFTVINLI